jgi:ADP-ribose pyrophosphatase
VLVRQYRPPVDGYVVEFPAGLIDPGETPQEAGVRELREEVGFSGEVVSIIPPTFNTPGLSGETVYHVLMRIPDGQTPQPEPDDGEHIELLLLPEGEIEEFLRREIAAGTNFDSKVMSYLCGILAARKMSAPNWLPTLPGRPL